MIGKTFLVESCNLEEKKSSIFWQGQIINTLGHFICSGDEHRFLIYFLEDHIEKPSPEFLKKYRLGAKFVSYSELSDYSKLSKINEPIYAYLNSESPELNCVSVNEPVKEYMF